MLYQVLRRVVPDCDEPDCVDIIPGLTQVVWEGTDRSKASHQLNMAQGVKAPEGSICVIRKYEYFAWRTINI